MGVLGVLSVIAGIVFLPFSAWEPLETFLEPTFEDSIVVHTANTAVEWLGIALTCVFSVGGILIAHRIWGRGDGRAAAWQARFPHVHRLFVNKWYFDELIGLLIVRPVAWFGRWGRDSFERIVINGALIGGTTGIVRAGSAAVRALQTGLTRSYAGLVIAGLSVVLLYLLVRAA